jgi:hypothetical protein
MAFHELLLERIENVGSGRLTEKRKVNRSAQFMFMAPGPVPLRFPTIIFTEG